MIHTIDSNPTTVTRRTAVRPTVSVRSEAEIESIARAGALVGGILEDLRSRVRPGTTTAALASRAACLIDAANADALPLSCVNEDGDCFTHAICTSVDDVVLHGVPNDTPLVEGQIVSLDCSLRLDGWCADAAITVAVGDTAPERSRLIETCDALLETTIDLVRPGVRWSRIARIMQELALDAGFGVITDFGGHGIGRDIHEQPEVPSAVTPHLDAGGDFTLRPGMVVAIEPTLVLPGDISGPARDRLGRACGVPMAQDADGWAVRTLDGAAAAHVDHTIAVDRAGARVLTRRPEPDSPRGVASGRGPQL